MDELLHRYSAGKECVGAGSGLDDAGIRHKYEVLKQSLDNYKGDGSPRDIIRYFGGLEMVMAVGAMLQAAELKMIILVDGFIMTNCILAPPSSIPKCCIMPYSDIAEMNTGINLCLIH